MARRIITIVSASLPLPDRMTASHQGMKETGYIDGQNVAIAHRSAEGQTDRLPLLVADLLRRQVAVIVGNTSAALAAKAATMTVPIIFARGGDPVKLGLVSRLNRPGGNVTGVSFVSLELGTKHLGLLRELRPGAARIAVLVDPKSPTTEPLATPPATQCHRSRAGRTAFCTTGAKHASNTNSPRNDHPTTHSPSSKKNVGSMCFV
jgi:ABC-type uncharacterized transport system substrate-binding protein